MNLYRFQVRTRIRRHILRRLPPLVQLVSGGPPAEISVTREERKLLRRVRQRIHPGDTMLMFGEGHYFAVGLSALRAITAATRAAGLEPASILDLPCGHGRVLRFLKARYPEARLAACDLEREGVDFCASYFGAEPFYSELDLRRVNLGKRFDLIWVGSLLTHFDERRIGDALDLFARHLEPAGLLVFSTHGSGAVERIEAGESYGVNNEELLEGYRTTGFGHSAYPEQDYGVSLSSPAWVREKMRDWQEVWFGEKAWDNHHDVFAFRR